MDVSTARAIIGRPAEDVHAMVEEGRWLRWAFDVSAGGGKMRCIRIWRGSLLAWSSKQEDAATLAEVLDAVLLVKRPRLRASELVVGWQLSRPHVLDLVRDGQLQGETVEHTTWISRESAAEFLKKRVTGGSPSESFVGPRSLDPHQQASNAARGQQPLCMSLQEAYPPPSLKVPKTLSKG